MNPSTDSCLSNRIKVKAGAFALGHEIAKSRPAGTRTALLTHTIGGPTVSASGNIPRTPDSGQDLPPELLNRIRIAAQDPTGRLTVALLRQLCPGLTPAVALEWIRADLAFEQDVLNEAAILLGGEWTTNDHKENTQ